MEKNSLEQFASQIIEKNHYSKKMKILHLYTMLLSFLTFCIMVDYETIWQGNRTWMLVLLFLSMVHMILYSMEFTDAYTKVEGAKKRGEQKLSECRYQMPFSFGDYLGFVKSQYYKTVFLIRILFLGGSILGMFLGVEFDKSAKRLHYVFTMPENYETVFLTIVLLQFGVLVVLISSFFLYQSFTVNGFLDERHCKKRDGQKGKNGLYIRRGVTVLSIVITVSVIFYMLLKRDSDVIYTIIFMGMLAFLICLYLPIRFWYIVLLGVGIFLLYCYLQKKKKQENGNVTKKQGIGPNKKLVVLLHGIGFLALEVGILALSVFGYNVYIESDMAGYFTNDIAEYGEFDGHYEYEEGDRWTGLFLFPETLSENATEVEYCYYSHPMFLDSGYEIYLDATYPKMEFDAEVQRLKEISCTVTLNQKGESVTNRVQYVEGQCPYPAYVTICDYGGVYEYALVDEENCRIIYVYMQYVMNAYTPKKYHLVRGNDRIEGLEQNYFEGGFHLYYAEDENGDYPYYAD